MIVGGPIRRVIRNFTIYVKREIHVGKGRTVIIQVLSKKLVMRYLLVFSINLVLTKVLSYSNMS